MTLPPSARSTIRRLLVALGLVLGLLVATGGTAAADTPVLAAGFTALGAGRPTWNNGPHDRDRDRDRDHGRGDRDDNDGRHGGWHKRRWVVSPWQCRKGHGFVDWRHGRCWGGRYSGAWVGRW